MTTCGCLITYVNDESYLEENPCVGIVSIRIEGFEVSLKGFNIKVSLVTLSSCASEVQKS